MSRVTSIGVIPAAGNRNGSNVNNVGDNGNYWSSTANDSNNAYDVYFLSELVRPASGGSRSLGYSVRLITDVEGSSPVEPEPVKEDPLSGKFSVAEGKQIQFSPGNLQATFDGSKYSWGFAANQYDYVGNAAGNTTIKSQTIGAVVDLFGWSTSKTNFGISTSRDYADYSGGFVDWGQNIGDGSTWRTLSKDEWAYLFEARNNAFMLFMCHVTVCGKDNCVVIAPDGYTGTIATSYDASTWAAAEDNGLVCLPAAGFRFGSVVYNVGGSGAGTYWSSSAEDSDRAYYVYFNAYHVSPNDSNTREDGNSVRLITECQ